MKCFLTFIQTNKQKFKYIRNIKLTILIFEHSETDPSFQYQKHIYIFYIPFFFICQTFSSLFFIFIKTHIHILLSIFFLCQTFSSFFYIYENMPFNNVWRPLIVVMFLPKYRLQYECMECIAKQSAFFIRKNVCIL